MSNIVSSHLSDALGMPVTLSMPYIIECSITGPKEKTLSRFAGAKVLLFSDIRKETAIFEYAVLPFIKKKPPFCRKVSILCCVSKKKSTFALENRGVEQLVARQAHNLEVVRSSRASATKAFRHPSTDAFFCCLCSPSLTSYVLSVELKLFVKAASRLRVEPPQQNAKQVITTCFFCYFFLHNPN